MNEMPIVWGNVDQNAGILYSSGNFTVVRLSKGYYRVTYDSSLAFAYPPCVLAIGVYPGTDEKTRSATLQNCDQGSFEIFFKNNSGDMNDCGFNMTVYYDSTETTEE